MYLAIIVRDRSTPGEIALALQDIVGTIEGYEADYLENLNNDPLIIAQQLRDTL